MSDKGLIFRLAEYAAWKRCRWLLFAGRPIAKVRAEIDKRVLRETRKNKHPACVWIIDGWNAGFEHALRDYIRLTPLQADAAQAQYTAEQVELWPLG